MVNLPGVSSGLQVVTQSHRILAHWKVLVSSDWVATSVPTGRSSRSRLGTNMAVQTQLTGTHPSRLSMFGSLFTVESKYPGVARLNSKWVHSSVRAAFIWHLWCHRHHAFAHPEERFRANGSADGNDFQEKSSRRCARRRFGYSIGSCGGFIDGGRRRWQMKALPFWKTTQRF